MLEERETQDTLNPAGERVLPPSDCPLPTLLAETPRERWPKHIAMIMDGNGRWAQRQGLPRIEGHRRGVASVRCVSEECSRLGMEQLTLYCLSSENWKRPQQEIDFLMHLLEQYMIEERSTIMENNLRVRMIGRRENIPAQVLTELDKTVELSSTNDGMWLNLAINYGGRRELVDAVRKIAEEVSAQRLASDAIDEEVVSENLYTAGLDDPDLLVRTAGEMRISNFLLWQISYAEIWVTERCWPEFDEAALHEAIVSFASRNRKFGGLS
ncbi:MAG: isoprenyl transferase [Lacipirellulaceae bacterium]